MSNISLKQFFLQAFSFKYAGICTIDILPIRSKYQVITTGFNIDEGIVFFNQKSVVRITFDDLHTAILKFNELCTKICETTAWFTPEFFSQKNLQKIYSKRIYH